MQNPWRVLGRPRIRFREPAGTHRSRQTKPAPAAFLESWRGYRPVSRRAAVVQGISSTRRQVAHYFVHNTNDLPNDITAVTGGGVTK
jgi:hypothetical protein